VQRIFIFSRKFRWTILSKVLVLNSSKTEVGLYFYFMAAALGLW
jgi:hypothetical protein